MQRAYFITGGTGLVGSELVRRILAWDPGSEIHLLVRGRVPGIVTRRVDALLEELAPGDAAARARVHVHNGDLTMPGLGLAPAERDALAERVTHIIHSAADVRFDLPIEKARAINLAGTQSVFELARQAARRRLRRYTQISTYAVGRPEQGQMRVMETPPTARATYRNSYEQTKAEAEAHVLERRGEVPLIIARPSVIVGDSKTGYTQDFKVGYLLLRLYALGLLPEVLPFARGGMTDCVHLDEVADSIYGLGLAPGLESGSIFHVVAGASIHNSARAVERAAVSLRAELIAAGKPDPGSLVCQELDSVTPETLRARVTHPEAFATLESFMPYMSSRMRFDDSRTRRVVGAIVEWTPYTETVTQRMRYCVESDWGKVALARPPLRRAPVICDGAIQVIS